MTRPLKILCLHGYRQSGEQFRTKTGGFRKLFKKKCEYVFINAPHFIPGMVIFRCLVTVLSIETSESIGTALNTVEITQCFLLGVSGILEN